MLTVFAVVKMSGPAPNRRQILYAKSGHVWPLQVSYRRLINRGNRIIRLKNDTFYQDEVFCEINLSNNEVTNVEFENCSFTDCNFSSSQFLSCKFYQCEFKGCNLSLMNLSHTELQTVHFVECKLMGTDWTKAHWPSFMIDFDLRFTRCILNDCSFFALTLNTLSMTESKLQHTDFREGDFTDASMTECDFSHSLFSHTNLSGVDFTGSTGCAISVLNNQLAGATFSRLEALYLLESLNIRLVD